MNSAFFGRETRSRFVCNSVMRTLDESGRQITTLVQMKIRVVEHFTSLFHYEARPSPTWVAEFSMMINNGVNAWSRVFLVKEEVKFILLSMVNAWESPGSRRDSDRFL